MKLKKHRPSTLDTSIKSRTPYRDGSESFNATSPLVGNNRLRHKYSKIATLKVALSIKSYPGPRGFPWNFFREREWAANRRGEREGKNLWLPWPRISLSCIRLLSNASNCIFSRNSFFYKIFDNIKDLGPAWQNITRNHRIHGQKKIFKLFRSRKQFGVN